MFLPGLLLIINDSVWEGVSLPESELDMFPNSVLQKVVSLFSVESPSSFLRVNLCGSRMSIIEKEILWLAVVFSAGSWCSNILSRARCPEQTRALRQENGDARDLPSLSSRS